MSPQIFYSSLLSLLPALLLCVYVYLKDRVEKEPGILLGMLFCFGAIAYIPAYFIEKGVTKCFDILFSNNISLSVTGEFIYESTANHILHSVLCSFVGVALIEEAMKYLVLFFTTRKNKNFNCLYDGIVYAVFVSFGFSLVENVRFAIADGWDTFILRAVTSVPSHVLFGILTGFLYTLWHILSVAKTKEQKLFDEQTISETKIKHTGYLLFLSFLVPFIMHGISFFLKMYDNRALMTIYYVLIVILYISCFVIVHKLSKYDQTDSVLSDKIIAKKHPEMNNTKEGSV